MSIDATMPAGGSQSPIEVDPASLHGVAGRVGEAARWLGVGWQLPAVPAGPAGAALAEAGGQWTAHLRDLHGVLSATARVLHEVADTYAQAEAQARTEAGRWSW